MIFKKNIFENAFCSLCRLQRQEIMSWVSFAAFDSRLEDEHKKNENRKSKKKINKASTDVQKSFKIFIHPLDVAFACFKEDSIRIVTQ